MRKKRTALLAAAALVVGAGATGGYAIAAGGDDDGEAPITGPALARAEAAALAHTGGGRVTETEVGDEESLYEVEVTLPNGDQVDVQLDEQFNVVGDSPDTDGPGDDDADGSDD